MLGDELTNGGLEKAPRGFDADEGDEAGDLHRVVVLEDLDDGPGPGKNGGISPHLAADLDVRVPVDSSKFDVGAGLHQQVLVLRHEILRVICGF